MYIYFLFVVFFFLGFSEIDNNYFCRILFFSFFFKVWYFFLYMLLYIIFINVWNCYEVVEKLMLMVIYGSNLWIVKYFFWVDDLEWNILMKIKLMLKRSMKLENKIVERGFGRSLIWKKLKMDVLFFCYLVFGFERFG